MRIIYPIVLLFLLAIGPNSGNVHALDTVHESGSGTIDSGKTKGTQIETNVGIIKGNVSVDKAPIEVWFVPTVYIGEDGEFSSEYALYHDLGVFIGFNFYSTYQGSLRLIMKNGYNESQSYRYSIDYEGPIDVIAAIYRVPPFLGLLILVAPFAAGILYLKRRKN